MRVRARVRKDKAKPKSEAGVFLSPGKESVTLEDMGVKGRVCCVLDCISAVTRADPFAAATAHQMGRASTSRLTVGAFTCSPRN